MFTIQRNLSVFLWRTIFAVFFIFFCERVRLAVKFFMLCLLLSQQMTIDIQSTCWAFEPWLTGVIDVLTESGHAIPCPDIHSWSWRAPCSFPHLRAVNFPPLAGARSPPWTRSSTWWGGGFRGLEDSLCRVRLSARSGYLPGEFLRLWLPVLRLGSIGNSYLEGWSGLLSDLEMKTSLLNP